MGKLVRRIKYLLIFMFSIYSHSSFCQESCEWSGKEQNAISGQNVKKYLARAFIELINEVANTEWVREWLGRTESPGVSLRLLKELLTQDMQEYNN